jgi:hypothetical protein
MNVTASSSVNSLNFQTEYQAAQGNNASTEGFASGVTVPSSSTAHQSDGIAGYVTNSSASTNAVGGYLQARCLVNGTTCWGANFVSRDVAGLTTGVTLYGNEIDVNPLNSTTAYSGVTGFLMQLNTPITGTFPGNGAFYAASSNSGSKWFAGYQTGDNAAGIGILLGGACASSGSCSSQAINLRSFSSGVLATASISSDAAGDIILAPATTVVKVNSTPLTQSIGSGTSTSNGTSIASGVSQAQPAITITGATTTDVAICSLNATPVATWQTGIQLLPAVVTANTVTPWLSNPTAGSITPAATVIRCTVIR